MKRIDFSKIKILVVERLKDVKKRGVFTRHANRLLSHRTYRHVLSRLELLCEENRVQIAEVEPIGTNKVCARCGSRGIRRDERFVCKRCGVGISERINRWTW